MKRVIATVGPSLLNKFPLNEIHKDNYIYRINGAHGSYEDIRKYIDKIRSQVPDAKILMDLPGNKVRTSNIANGGLKIEENKIFSLQFDQFNFVDFYKFIKVGDVIWANDSTYEFHVDSICNTTKKIYFLSKSTGILLNNKGMHVRGIHQHIPFLFQKDQKLIEIANETKVAFVGLSFVRHAEDVNQAVNLLNDNIEIITKVETKSAVKHLNSILDIAPYILIDRGDLSTEVSLEKVPRFQNYIIQKALFHDRKVFLATQFLKNMENNPIPTIPEIIDLHNTLQKGIYGIQLSEETAVGRYPYECLKTIEKVHNEIDSSVLSELN